MFKKELPLRSNESDLTYASFEYIERLFKLGPKWIRLIIVYRPPPSTSNGLTVPQFFAEFTTFLERLVALPGEVLIQGDFNFHIDDASDTHATEFLELLDVFNLTQHVSHSTHKSGHILDLVITGKELKMNLSDSRILIHPSWISDHSLLQFELEISKPPPLSKTVTVRNWKSVDVSNFIEDLEGSDLHNLKNLDLSDSALLYNSVLHGLADKYAPRREKNIVSRPRAPWFTPELRQLKREKRQLERRYRRTGTLTDVQRFNAHCDRYCNLLTSTRESFYLDKIQDGAGNQKALFSVIDKLLHRNNELALPIYDTLSELTNRFADYFINKIYCIRSDLDLDTSVSTTNHEPDVVSPVSCRLGSFSAVTTRDIESFISKTNNKFCSLDPIPTTLLKECLLSLLPAITHIVNCSISSTMPEVYKEAIITPILKKPNLNTEELSNYRPISNLAYLSKLIEKVVAKQINDYTSANQLEETMQSAYRQYHSTETALIRIHNDILMALDNNESVLFVSLDLSAAFDTIDHNILLRRLENCFGITGNCLSWISSYLEGRTLRVVIDGTASEAKDIKFGVPQGSVLGPKLFTMYLIPIGSIARRHNVKIHLYADDCQLYITFKKEGTSLVKPQMECLLHEIRVWMSASKLKLNDDKTEIIVLAGPRRSLDLSQLSPLLVGNEPVRIKNSTRILGCSLDSKMTLKEHIIDITKNCFFKLKNMYNIRRCLSDDAAKVLVHAMITSKLDYCNAILYGLPSCNLKYLQSVQNTAARFITRTRKYSHITPVFKDLHWLPIKSRIEYKILLMVHKSLHGLTPTYLNELLHRRPPKGTRADGNNDLLIPRFSRSTFGGRAFSNSGPRLWNKLPKYLKNIKELKTFKKYLKTHIFTNIYN